MKNYQINKVVCQTDSEKQYDRFWTLYVFKLLIAIVVGYYKHTMKFKGFENKQGSHLKM